MKIIRSLLDHLIGRNMLDIDARAGGDATPLYIAYRKRGRRYANLALGFGADVGLEYKAGETLFYIALLEFDWSFALKLLERGASPDFDVVRRWPPWISLPSRLTTDWFRTEMASLQREGVGRKAAALTNRLDRFYGNYR